MEAKLDEFGYAVVTDTGIRCGCCKKRHANVATIKACFARDYYDAMEQQAEIEIERRTTRYYEEGF